MVHPYYSCDSVGSSSASWTGHFNSCLLLYQGLNHSDNLQLKHKDLSDAILMVALPNTVTAVLETTSSAHRLKDFKNKSQK